LIATTASAINQSRKTFLDRKIDALMRHHFLGGNSMDDDNAPDPTVSRRWLGRAVLLGGGVAAVAGTTPAQAATASTGWRLGGNAGVTTDGKNYLGTNNPAPLIFKTAQHASQPVERMRIAPTGELLIRGSAAIGTSAKTGTALNVATATKDGIGVLAAAPNGANATGVYGTSPDGIGVHGSSNHNFAVFGTSLDGSGVRGETYTAGSSIAAIDGRGIGTGNTGVRGISNHGLGVAGFTQDGKGVFGRSTADGTGARGVHGEALGAGSIGVLGVADKDDNCSGVRGTSLNGVGVHGDSLHNFAVFGTTEDGAGVNGTCYDVGGTGVFGASRSPGLGTGVFAYAASGKSYALFAENLNSDNQGAAYAGYFNGTVSIQGALSKTSGSFKIDHPLDPSNKYLYHSFVESPDMMNVYNGNVVTDDHGRATVTLPDYFMALNKDFRYQLTVIGQFAQAVIGRKIDNGQFDIHTDKPDVEVSWQVTGIRQDAFAEAHRVPTTLDKPADELGTYLHPEVHGQPATKALHYGRAPTPRDRPAQAPVG
jgi:hypothetical protein